MGRCLAAVCVTALLAIAIFTLANAQAETPTSRVVLCALGLSASDEVPLFEYGKSLKGLGYNVTLIAPRETLDSARAYGFDEYSVGSALPVNFSRLSREQWSVASFSDLKFSYSHQYYAHLFDKLTDDLTEMKPDFMIADMHADLCSDLALGLRIPRAVSVHHLGYGSLGQEQLFVPNTVMGWSRSLSFIERVHNYLIMPFKFAWGYYLKTQRPLNKYRQSRGLPTSFLPGGNWKNTIQLVNSFEGFEYAQKLHPLINMAGPVMRSEFPPLPETVAVWLSACEKAKQAVVYVYFGSEAVLSEEQVTKVIEALECSQFYALWVMGNTPKSHFPSDLPPSILLVEDHLAPVQVLNHSAVKVALIDGSSEALYASLVLGKPLIPIPFFGVAYSNAGKLFDWRAAPILNKDTFTGSNLCQHIRNVTMPGTKLHVSFSRLHLLAKHASEDAAAKVASYIDLCIKVGSMHMITYDQLQPMWQLYNLDVWLLFFLILYYIYRIFRIVYPWWKQYRRESSRIVEETLASRAVPKNKENKTTNGDAGNGVANSGESSVRNRKAPQTENGGASTVPQGDKKGQ